MCGSLATRRPSAVEDRKVQGEAETQQKDGQKRLSQLAEFQALDLAKELAPIEAAAAVQQLCIAELELEIGRLAILRTDTRPGRRRTPLAAGERQAGRSNRDRGRRTGPLSDRLCPARTAHQAKRGHAGGRARSGPTSYPVSTVECVGPQVELIPQHLCRDPKMPEWGLPVRITRPKNFVGRPGELFELTFKPRESDGI